MQCLGAAFLGKTLFFALCCAWLSLSSALAWTWTFDPSSILDNTATNLSDAYTRILPHLVYWESGQFHALDGQEDSGRFTFRFHPDDLQIDDIGRWENFDVFHTFDSNQWHRAVLLRDDSGLWHFLQAAFWFENCMDSLPEIWSVDGLSILASRVPIPGNGGWWQEEYWVLPPGADWPVLLDVSAVPATARRIVPAGCLSGTGFRSGSWDLQNLRYSSFVWRPDDGSCCPSGGSVDMALSIIDGTRVVPASVRWSPSGDEFTTAHLLRPLNLSGWQVYVADGKTGAIPDISPGAPSIREAYESVLPVLYPWAFAPENPQPLSLDALEDSIRFLEPWEGFRLAQVVLPEQNHQAILMEIPGLGWHFAFLQFGSMPGVPWGISPERWIVDGRPVLANRLPCNTAEGSCLDIYWVKDESSGEPRLLDFAAIEGAEIRTSPQLGYTRPSTGKLDLRNLSFSTPVWTPNSSSHPHRPPLGGRIDMTLAIKGSKVAVSDARWIPPPENAELIARGGVRRKTPRAPEKTNQMETFSNDNSRGTQPRNKGTRHE